jgi:hypothetical protein
MSDDIKPVESEESQVIVNHVNNQNDMNDFWVSRLNEISVKAFDFKTSVSDYWQQRSAQLQADIYKVNKKINVCLCLISVSVIILAIELGFALHLILDLFKNLLQG